MKKQTVSFITGTGRSGTTLLISIAAALGKTKAHGSYSKTVRGGYETRTDLDQFGHWELPPIIKDPRLIASLDQVLGSKPVTFNHAFLTIRDFNQAALSRIDKNLFFSKYGNLIEEFGDTSLKKHVVFFQRAVGSFIEAISKHDIPLTILRFPRFALDLDYLHSKLVGTPMESSKEQLAEACAMLVRKDWIGEY